MELILQTVFLTGGTQLRKLTSLFAEVSLRPCKDRVVETDGGCLEQAGPFGLEVALSLARQGLKFRIIDKAAGPLLVGRADGTHPRMLELLHCWGIAQEVHEEGPLLNHTAMYKNGEQLMYTRSFTCDSRYKGSHVITQGQLERIYIRDLLRHKVLVERSTETGEIKVEPEKGTSHPVRVQIRNIQTGGTQTVNAKYLVGAEGAGSGIRKQLSFPFDGITTDIHWGIMDCKYETNYPHMTTFGVYMNTEHGACIIVPREEGYTRIYTKLSAERVKELAEDRRESGGRVDAQSITPEEILEQTNKVMAPYYVRFAGPISWFAVWKISERVARYFSTPDMRIHLGGDAAHVHSVLGAFGLNSSVYDASNLGWKLGLSVRGLADPRKLLPTYDLERRVFANRVIRASGAYLRFVGGISDLPLAQLRSATGEELESYMEDLPALDGTREADLRWIGAFFGRNAGFLLGVDLPHMPSCIAPPTPIYSEDNTKTNGTIISAEGPPQTPITVHNGRRAPNPRICFSQCMTGYLYDKMTGASRFHILIFGSDLRGPVRQRMAHFSHEALGHHGVLNKFGGTEMFNVLLILKALPHETQGVLQGNDLRNLRGFAPTVVYDDRTPDEDAAYWYGINHARGAIVAVRPDLVVGMSCWPEEAEMKLDEYFDGFLIDKGVRTAREWAVVREMKQTGKENGMVNGMVNGTANDGALEHNSAGEAKSQA
ncbi:MAG: hypothetical protein M1831_000051 [Alyxoria varia]|nr:MAG: hypothetical protein M1831_000051 [Alyxoria varia]